MESSGAPGRARGRARGRASTAPTVSAEEASVSMQAMRISPVPGDNGNGGDGEPSNGILLLITHFILISFSEHFFLFENISYLITITF